MKRLLVLLYFAIAVVVANAHAQENGKTQHQHEFFRAKVIRIVDEGIGEFLGNSNYFQKIEAFIESGSEKGKTVTVINGGEISITEDQKLTIGDRIIVLKNFNALTNKESYTIYEIYRLNNILFIIGAFLLFAILLAGWKGIGSILGLITSFAVIMVYIVPRILAGENPVIVSIAGAIIILASSTYMAHGVSWQTTIAVISTFISLIITSLLSVAFVNITKLTGLVEDGSLLQTLAGNPINLKGLLLGGIIIGTLGALDDITHAQAASIFELARTNTNLTVFQLFKKGFAIGKEHIASLMNTLVLAYAGSSLIVFLFFAINPLNVPYWVILNNELTSGEIVRTAAGSMGLMSVVPVATLLSAIAAKRSR
jgi:uncharacterized membrane protein